jgi:hypothetical protein
MIIDLKITGTTNNIDLEINNPNNPDNSENTDESEAVE